MNDTCCLPPILPNECPEPFPRYVTVKNTKYGRTFRCEVCRQTYDDKVYSYRQIVADLRSKNHIRGMEAYNECYCEPCKMQFLCKSKYDRHCRTRAHQDKTSGKLPPKVDCEVCNLVFHCPAAYTSHLATKGHARKLLPPPKRDCEICGIHVLSDKQMEAHLATRKHQRRSQEKAANDAPVKIV